MFRTYLPVISQCKPEIWGMGLPCNYLYQSYLPAQITFFEINVRYAHSTSSIRQNVIKCKEFKPFVMLKEGP